MKNTIAKLIPVVGLVLVTQLDGAAQTRAGKKIRVLTPAGFGDRN